MQEDTQEVEVKENAAATKEVVHTYYEVDNDLLSKPKALISLLATGEKGASTVVFCNSPSEADLVEVMLKKEGFSSEKLIGHVPFVKVTQAIQKMKEGGLAAVILTDVAARELDVTDIDVVVNYSVHEDPEIYLHRITGFESECRLSSVVTLVSSMDFANFHYLKKIVEFEMQKGELPDEGVIVKAKFNSSMDTAREQAATLPDSFKEMAAELLELDDKQEIIAALLNNTLTVIPALQASASERGSNDKRGGRNDRNDRRDRDNDRGNRNNRRNSRDRDDNNRRERRERREPAKKDIRIYLGHGSKDNFTEEKLREMLSATDCAVTPEQLRRFNARGAYSFVDVPEEVADSVLTTLTDLEVDAGTKMFTRKATYISQPREEAPKEEEKEAVASDEETASAEEVSVEVQAEEKVEETSQAAVE